jgi:hypothetical protein
MKVQITTLLGVIPSVRLLTDATPLPPDCSSLQTHCGSKSKVTCPTCMPALLKQIDLTDLHEDRLKITPFAPFYRRDVISSVIVPRVGPTPKGPLEEGPSGGRSSDDPSSAPTNFRDPTGPESSDPFGGIHELTLPRPGTAGRNHGSAPAAPPAALEQAIAIQNPPAGLETLFSDAVRYMSPGGGKELEADESIFYSGALEFDASEYIDVQGGFNMETSLEEFEDPVGMSLQEITQIRSAAFAEASRG